MKKRFNIQMMVLLAGVFFVVCGCQTPDVVSADSEAKAMAVKPAAEEAEGTAKGDMVEEASGFLAGSDAQEDEDAPGKGDKQGVPEFSTWRSIGAILFVLGGLLAINAFLKKRASAMPGGSGKRLKVLERLPVDQRRQILLVEADGQRVLVGVGTDGMSSLTVLSGEGEVESDA